jgi:hypothetical protein
MKLRSVNGNKGMTISLESSDPEKVACKSKLFFQAAVKFHQNKPDSCQTLSSVQQ